MEYHQYTESDTKVSAHPHPAVQYHRRYRQLSGNARSLVGSNHQGKYVQYHKNGKTEQVHTRLSPEFSVQLPENRRA